LAGAAFGFAFAGLGLAFAAGFFLGGIARIIRRGAPQGKLC
jgi:hypothetical protein